MVEVNFSLKPDSLNWFYLVSAIPFIVLMIDVYTIHSIFASLFAFSVHEFGHYIGAKMYDIDVDEIHLTLFGSYIDMRGGKLSLEENFIISFLGPLFGILSIMVSYPYLRLFLEPFLSNTICVLIIISNLFNLIPIKGSDGYHMIKCIQKN